MTEQDWSQYKGLTCRQKFIKRAFDLIVGVAGLIVFGPVIVITFIVATIDTGTSGFFVQQRIGRHGKPFRVVKIRTMRQVSSGRLETTVTTANDARITRIGGFMRNYKLDELPQLINVVWGSMSFVGPRPDVTGFADHLAGDERAVLSVRPGITGPATLKYRQEEQLLAEQLDPEQYNRDVIYPDKVRVNLDYIRDYSFRKDLACIWQTIMG